MAPFDHREKQKLAIINHIISEHKRRRNMQQCIVTMSSVRRRMIMRTCFLAFLTLSHMKNNATRIELRGRQRSCRRYTRNRGWWENVWHSYSERQSTKTFRVSRATFSFILSKNGIPLKKSR